MLLLLTAGCYFERNESYEEEDEYEQASEEETEEASENGAGIRISEPDEGDTIDPSTGVTLTGEARGPWFFEGVFPVKIYDAEGNLLAQTQAVAIDDWMTTDWVSFTATIETFDVGDATSGTLVFEKDNPSGLPENADSFEISVQFTTAEESGSNMQIEKQEFEFGGQSDTETGSDIDTGWDLKENQSI